MYLWAPLYFSSLTTWIVFKDEGKTVTLELRVDPADMGKVIGRQGKIAKSIRTVMKALAAKENKKITIEFIG